MGGKRCHASARTLAKRNDARVVWAMDALVECLIEGEAALERGEYSHAVVAFTRALEAAPAESAIALMLANAHRLAGDTIASRAVLLSAFHTSLPSDPKQRYEFGAALLDAGAPLEASECFTLVVKALPKDPAALAALAGARRTLGQAAEAWPLIQRALVSSTTHPAYLLTAAQIRHDMGDRKGALRWLDMADSVRGGHGPTQLQRAYTTMLGGLSAEGWRLFESRPRPVPATSARAWSGEPLTGGSILVTAEQGVGDQFQFLRFVPLLAKRLPARIVLECHADAVSLLTSNGIDAVARGNPPETDWHVPLLSLPHILGLGDAVLGDAVPYLRALQNYSALPLPQAPPEGLRLGLIWAGNPAFSGRVTRDLDLSLLPELLDIPRVTWVSLQQGAIDPAVQAGLAGVHLLPSFGDWATTAAILAQLYGLVTTDTGIAHLAGAMGVRTWVMLQHVPDWRWGLTGETTPWYPTLTLVRPKASRDWGGVVAKVRGMIQAHIAESAQGGDR